MYPTAYSFFQNNLVPIMAKVHFLYRVPFSFNMYGRAFEILSKLVRSQWLKIEKFHITKEANWHFSFLNRLSNEVPQSQKQNPSAKHSQSATFGGSPAKQGRALTTSVLVRFVWNFGFRVYKYWIFLKTTCPHEIQSSQMP